MEFIDVISCILTRIMLGLLSPGSAKADVSVKWKVKHLFNSQLCEKYFCQKILKLLSHSSS